MFILLITIVVIHKLGLTLNKIYFLTEINLLEKQH